MGASFCRKQQHPDPCFVHSAVHYDSAGNLPAVVSAHVAKRAEDILKPYAEYTLAQYQADNENQKKKWKEVASDLVGALKTDVQFELTGSCASGLAYPPPYGDWDCAFVADADELRKLQEKFAQTFSAEPDNKQCKTPRPGTLFEKAQFPMGFWFCTKAGLPWIPAIIQPWSKEGDDKQVKLDITFRTTAQHHILQTHSAAAISKQLPSDSDKLNYIRAQHRAAVVKVLAKKYGLEDLHNETEAAYLKRKSFLIPH